MTQQPHQQQEDGVVDEDAPTPPLIKQTATRALKRDTAAEFAERWGLCLRHERDLATTISSHKTLLSGVRLHIISPDNRFTLWIRRDSVNLDDPDENIHVTALLLVGSANALQHIVRLPFTSISEPSEYERRISRDPELQLGTTWLLQGLPRSKKHHLTRHSIMSFLEANEGRTVGRKDRPFQLRILMYRGPRDVYDVVHGKAAHLQRSPNFGPSPSTLSSRMSYEDTRIALLDLFSSDVYLTTRAHLYLEVHIRNEDEAGDESQSTYVVPLVWVMLSSHSGGGKDHAALGQAASALNTLVYHKKMEDVTLAMRNPFTSLLISAFSQTRKRNFVFSINPVRRHESLRLLSAIENTFHVTPLAFPTLTHYVTARIIRAMRRWANLARTYDIMFAREPQDRIVVGRDPVTFTVRLSFRSQVAVRNSDQSRDVFIINSNKSFRFVRGECDVELDPVGVVGPHSVAVTWNGVTIRSKSFQVVKRPAEVHSALTLCFIQQPPTHVEVGELFEVVVSERLGRCEGAVLELLCYSSNSTAANSAAMGRMQDGRAVFTLHCEHAGTFQYSVRCRELGLSPIFTHTVTVKTTPIPLDVVIITTPPMNSISAQFPVSINVRAHPNYDADEKFRGVKLNGIIELMLCDDYNSTTALPRGNFVDGEGTISNMYLQESGGHDVHFTVAITGDATLANGERLAFRCTKESTPFVVQLTCRTLDLKAVRRQLGPVMIGHAITCDVAIEGTPEHMPETCTAYARIDDARVAFRVQGGFITGQLVRGRGLLRDMKIPCLGRFDLVVRVPLPSGQALTAYVTKIEITDNVELLQLQKDERRARFSIAWREDVCALDFELYREMQAMERANLCVLETIRRVGVHEALEESMPELWEAYRFLENTTAQYFMERRLITEGYLDITDQPAIETGINTYFTVTVVMKNEAHGDDVLTFANGLAEISPANPIPGLLASQQLGGEIGVHLVEGVARFNICVHLLGRMQLQLRVYPSNCDANAIPFTIYTTPFEVAPPMTAEEMLFRGAIEVARKKAERFNAVLAAAKMTTVGRNNNNNTEKGHNRKTVMLAETETFSNPDDHITFLPKFPKNLVMLRGFTFRVEVALDESVNAVEESGIGRLQLLRVTPEGQILDTQSLLLPLEAVEATDGFLTWETVLFARSGQYSFRLEYTPREDTSTTRNGSVASTATRNSSVHQLKRNASKKQSSSRLSATSSHHLTTMRSRKSLVDPESKIDFSSAHTYVHITEPFTVRSPELTLCVLESSATELATGSYMELEFEVLVNGQASEVALSGASVAVTTVENIGVNGDWLPFPIDAFFDPDTDRCAALQGLATFRMTPLVIAPEGCYRMTAQAYVPPPLGPFEVSCLVTDVIIGPPNVFTPRQADLLSNSSMSQPSFSPRLRFQHVAAVSCFVSKLRMSAVRSPVRGPSTKSAAVANTTPAVFLKLQNTPIHHVRPQRRHVEVTMGLQSVQPPEAKDRCLTSNRVALHPKRVEQRPVSNWIKWDRERIWAQQSSEAARAAAAAASSASPAKRYALMRSPRRSKS
eukprot:PhM_4_TR17346/c0_g1_i1/m.41695